MVSIDGMTYRMEEVGSWSWQKGENGSITLTASPPGVTPPAAAARQGRGRTGNGGSTNADLGKKLVGALTPALSSHAEELRAKARASMDAAKEKAAVDKAAAEAATPTRGAPPPEETDSADDADSESDL